MSNYIAVICDSHECDNKHMLQILSKASRLAQQSQRKVIALCIGTGDNSKLDTLFKYGAEEVLLCIQKEPFDLPYLTEVFAGMVKEVEPDILLLPATVNGKNIAAILSTRFNAGLTADCIDIEFDHDGILYFSRAAINSTVIAKIKCINCNMMMGTVKKDVFIELERAQPLERVVKEFAYTGTRVKLSPEWKIMERKEKVDQKTVDISKFDKVFCIGRGVKSMEIFERICVLARKLGVGIVGTRAMVEEGYIDKYLQVGQSGKSISPKLYISFGVFGASQHMVGIKNVATIVAINNDENAAIFEYADYSIVDQIENIFVELEKMLVP